MKIRRVAMECGLCRSARAARLPVLRERGYGKLEQSSASGGGKTASFRDQKAVGGDTKCGVMVKPSPAAAFKVPQPQFLLQFFVVSFNDPSSFGDTH